MDAGKEDIAKFGDLILWKEVLRYAHENGKNIIFITNDTKEDWWENSKELVARSELYEEVKYTNSSVNITLLTLQTFFELMSYYYKVDGFMTALELKLKLKEDIQNLLSQKDRIK